jgi:hypothetical protein
MRPDRSLMLSKRVTANTVLLLAAVGLRSYAEASDASQSTGKPPSAEELRFLSDSVVDDVIHARRHVLYTKLCKTNLPSETSIVAGLDLIERAYGKLLEAELESTGHGWFEDLSRQRHPLWAFNYRVRTSTAPVGTYSAVVRLMTDPVLCVQSYNVVSPVPAGKQ